MKLARAIGLLLCAVAMCSAAPSTSQAQTLGHYGHGGFAAPGWFGYFGSPYSLGQIPTPPYFAIHPPVYYSVPVARTYGYSPYAYPGTFQTPEVVMPEMIENPHVEQLPETEPASNVKVVKYQVIHNPYAKSALGLDQETRLTAVQP
jgi:hypothetical protein